jgi:DNA mismatch repair protein MutS2
LYCLNIHPHNGAAQLEFEKILELLEVACNTQYAKEKAARLTPSIYGDEIKMQLLQTHQLKLLIDAGTNFPLQHTINVAKELKLLSLQGSSLVPEQWVMIRKLLSNTEHIFRWLDSEKRDLYPELAVLLGGVYYDKHISEEINKILDDAGIVRDSASKELQTIRTELYRKRSEQRHKFNRIVDKLRKLGYTTDTEEAFLNGRKVVAIFSEHKRQIKGIFMGESDTRKTSFIEPEETIEINNQVFELEIAEQREVQRIMMQLTSDIRPYHPLLQQYYVLNGELDFIYAKARLAGNMNAYLPVLSYKSEFSIIDAYHPLLLLHNKKLGKPTVPLSLSLNAKERILVVSGPNAGGKTIAMKTIGLLQLMLQCGLLVPASPDSTFGLFKQLLIHIGDAQSIEHELSTYSSHLGNMKYFLDHANGRSMVLIDEFGGGTDPNLGGAIAEAILETFVRRHSIGIVTTHYLNIKVLASNTKGLINGSMAFDERKLLPLYKLLVGKPGSSYTFSIAQRIGLDEQLIERARSLAKVEQVELDSLLNDTEQDLQQIEADKLELKKLLQEQDRLNAELSIALKKERHKQEVEKLKHKNKITEERMQELRDQERRIKQAVLEWKKTKNKSDAIVNMENLLFYKKAKALEVQEEKKFLQKYKVVGGAIKVGALVRMRSTNQVAQVKELQSGNRATIQLGLLPVNIDMDDLEIVVSK